MNVFRRQADLSRPRGAPNLGVHYDSDAFGRFSEGIARTLGTGKFLFAQTILVITWILINAAAASLRWDPYPFILLNLAFSTQAAYAAPLILLAQNRQDDRDRAQAETDRQIQARTSADTDFLSRELASVRLALSDVVTHEDLRDVVGDLVDAIERIEQKLPD